LAKEIPPFAAAFLVVTVLLRFGPAAEAGDPRKSFHPADP
jgi:hypothetical protein